MLRLIVRQGASLPSATAFRRHHVDDSVFKSKLPHMRSAVFTHSSGPVRAFWWSGNGGDDDDEKKKPKKDDVPKKGDEEVEKVEKVELEPDATAKKSSVLSRASGESAPRPSQLIALHSMHRPLFPMFMMPLTITDQSTMNAILSRKKSSNPWVGVFLAQPTLSEAPLDQFVLRHVDQLCRVGTLANVQSITATPEGMQLLLMGHRRIRITDVVTDGPPLQVQVDHIDTPRDQGSNPTVKAYANEILACIREIVKLNPMFREHVQYFVQTADLNDPWRLADFAASLTTSQGFELQEVLESELLEVRLSKTLELLKKEKELSVLQQEINKDVEQRISKTNRKYFLMEQLKSIKKELGMEKDDKDALVQKFRDRMKELKLPPTAQLVMDEEIEKMSVLEKNSPEFNVTRSYLDWLTSIPWGVFSKDNLDISVARGILNEDHYGLQDVKERILEFIAVGKLKGTVQGKILCIVGPPGVGKTSIGKSIARSLDRKFYRFSVGGLSDVAEIKGHRRTYIGAMPGKLIQCLKTTGVSNPLVLIDEIDKLGKGGHHGDPASALLEMLDPNQNTSFMDHYLDTPVDASKVLFVCTANTLETIPGPLLDRMEVIRLSGYDFQEKLVIARQYLEPKIRVELGLQPDLPSTPPSLHLETSAVEALIRWYCRESGVRNLEKHVEKVYRKVALKVASRVEAAAAKLAPKAAKTEEAAAPAAPASPSIVADSTFGSAGDLTKLAEEEPKPAPAPAPAAAEPVKPVDLVTSLGLIPDDLFSADEDWAITEKNLSEYVGKPVFTSDRMYPDTPAGVVMGLAYTSMGGSALYIEVTTALAESSLLHRITARREKEDSEGGGSIKTTGQLGEVMQESTTIAHTVARKFLRKVSPDNLYLDVAPLHLHVPEGATPKDGPSAGVTIVTALLSLAMGRPVRQNLAMTGEVSLNGFVLPVGGIKEKTMAARRSGVTTLVFPAGNKKDVEELPDHLREGVTIHFAEKYEDVYAVAFSDDGVPAV